MEILMNNLPNRFLIVGALVGLTIPAVAEVQDQKWTSEEQAVIDAVKDGPIGIESNFDAWEQGYADDWSYWRVGDPEIRARDEHMALVRDFIDEGNRPTAFALEPVDLLIRGDIALLRLIAEETLLSPSGEEKVVRYASATVLTREDGVWKVLATNIVYLD
jgi:ketosteroid isomerase-like protein